ncbi:R2-like ligand-binding oxidase [Amycolatopsis methanolica]|nr:R2-like ligand-binding oxidase [Amycolatopsis methanolica]
MSVTRDIEPGHHHELGGVTDTGRRPDTVPRKLFRDGNANFWNPDDVDLTQDEADFAALTPEERRLTCVLIASLMAAGESVLQDLQPLVAAIATEGRPHDDAYLTQLVFEEAKHAQALRAWFGALGMGDDLPRFIASRDRHRRILLEELSWTLYTLADDHSPAAQIRASVAHNHLVEGFFVLTCYTAWARICRNRGIFTGLQRIIGHIATDERRHVAWGTFTCRRHVAADDTNWAIVTERTQELLPLATDVLGEMLAPFGPGAPFEISTQELVGSALYEVGRRLGSIARARGRRVEEVDRDHAPMRLEHEIAAYTADPVGRDIRRTVVPIRHQL